MKEFYAKKKDTAFTVGILFFVFLTMSFCLTGTFNHDDNVYFYLRGREIAEGVTLFDIIKMAYDAWIIRGRFSPLALWESYIFYYLFPTYWIYEFVIVFLTCFDVWLFGKLVGRINENKKAEFFSMVLMAIFFQVYTTYHNAIVGYAALMQFAVLFLLLECLFLDLYFETTKKRYLILSVVMQLAAVWLYEFGYFNVCFVLGVLLHNRKKLLDIFKIELLYCVPLFFNGLYSLYINIVSYNGGAYSGSKANLNFEIISKTFIKQLINVFPLTNYLFRRDADEALRFQSVFCEISVVEICIAIFGTVLFWSALKKMSEKNDKSPEGSSWLLAIGVFILPGLLPCITEKYQNELYLGISHIAVFMQYFGLAWISINLIQFIDVILEKKDKGSIKKTLHVLYTVIFAAVVLVNMLCTKRYVSFLNTSLKYPKEAVQNAASEGMFEVFDDDSRLLVLNAAQYNSTAFYSQNAKKKVAVITMDEIVSTMDVNNYEIDCDGEKIYVLKYSGTPNEKNAVLGRIDTIVLDESGQIVQIIVDGVSAYKEEGCMKLGNNRGESIVETDEKNEMIEMTQIEKTDFLQISVY